MKKYFGFTLAEVLITLAIIGVIATLTLPSLAQNYRKKVYVASIQRTYNEVSNGLAQFLSDKLADSTVDAGLNQSWVVNEFMNNYLRVNSASYDTSGFDSGTSYKTISGYGNYSYVSLLSQGGGYNWQCRTLKTGAGICMTPVNNGDNGMIVVDTNGKSGPNVIGRDLFNFRYFKNGDVGVGSVSSSYYYSSSYTYRCTGDGIGINCTGQLINDGWEMKY